ncbi:MAG: hypothetical protein FWC47_13635 [Oscillospiraceae bacterium]|nr:hypothetical protein [Oscillospiraceae bacterium]
MKYEFDKNDNVMESYDLWELDEKQQTYLKDLLEKYGFDKFMDIEDAFIPKEEEMETLGIEDLFPNATITVLSEDSKPVEIGSKLIAPGSSMKIKHTSEVKDFALDQRVNYSETVERIHLSKLVEIDNSINFFPLPDDEELLDLMEKIEMYGLISPLLVKKMSNTDQYIVVSGRSRLIALNHLYNNTSDESYLFPECLVLDPNTDSSTIQGIIISTNLAYRKISKDIQVKSILLLDKILSNSRTHRTQMNITDKIAESAGISRTTANTIRGFKNLSPLALDLLYKNHITRSAARILSMIKEKETQDLIINKMGNQINDIPKLREMLAGPGKGVYDEELKKSVPETWEKKIDRTLGMVPSTTKITLYVASGMVEDVLRAIIPLKGKAVLKYKAFKENEINKYLKVGLDDNHMEQYLRKGFVTQGIIDLARCTDYKELIKYSKGC